MPNRPQLDLYNWFLTLLQRNIETFRHAAFLNLETGFELKMPDPTAPPLTLKGAVRLGPDQNKVRDFAASAHSGRQTLTLDP